MRGKVISQISVTVCFMATVYSTFLQYTIYDPLFFLYPLSYTITAISACSLVLCMIYREEKFYFSVADLVIILLVIYYILRYDTVLQLANWKIIIAIQLLIYWFAIRVLLNATILPRSLLIWIFISLGCIQAIWGFLQLYGVCIPHHSLFPITGSFNNPGPYSCYIGIMIPIAMSQYLTSKGIEQYLALCAFLLMISILPAGMSRSAWIGVVFSVIWVISMHNNWMSAIKNYRKNNLRFLMGGIFLIIMLLAISMMLYVLKKDSAHGRVFIWKNTIHAIMEQPLKGYGPGMFPSVYSKAQSDYFSNGQYSATEEWVAGCPEYAFNEYLQIMIEGGFILLLLFGLLTSYALWKGIKQKKYGFCGGIIALLLFCCFSYPLQLPSFLVTATLLIAACISGHSSNGLYWNKVRPIFVTIILTIASIGLCCHLKPNYYIANTWQKCRLLKAAGIPESAEKGYESIYTSLRHNPFFLFEYAQILTKQKKYNESNTILKRVAKVKCDPMTYNMMGENYENMKLYNKAEKCYLHSINLLPGRLYPYYLLTFLYKEPGFRQPEKMDKMRKIVMTKKIKINSKATEEMRTKVKNTHIDEE